jgi:alpha-tubulin suppressor-like RCC1 family protein
VLWSWGDKDNGALGHRVLDSDDEAIPSQLQSWVDENFRVIKCTLGTNIGAVLSVNGELQVWGAFRVRDLCKSFLSSISD